MDTIINSREEILAKIKEAEKKYPPNKVEKFIFKNFVNSGEWTVAKILMIIIFLVFNIAAIIVYQQNGYSIDNPLCWAFLTIANGQIILLAIPWIYTFYANNARIRNIASEAGLTIEEYLDYV